MSYTVYNFYKFVEIDDLEDLRTRIADKARGLGLLGTILLAREGINAALVGTPECFGEFLDFLQADPRFSDLDVKVSQGESRPFHKLVVRVKRWIIRFAEDQDPSVDEIKAGRRLSPSDVMELVRNRPDDVVLIDTRNDYEVDLGTFKGAKTLPIRRFTEFPEAFLRAFGTEQDKTYIFFCTGGVRCEKVVPWAERAGFKNSYQLDGGILRHFQEHGSAEYEGDCFVFDERWVLAPDMRQRPGAERPPHYPKGHPQ